MAVIQIDIPDKLDKYLDNYIKNGWANSKEEILRESLTRYMESHNEELIENQIMDDVNWGLAK